jgi:hypothetical protein
MTNISYLFEEYGEVFPLFPSFTFRSFGGLPEPLLFGGGKPRCGVDPVNQMSARALGPVLTVARHLEVLFVGLTVACRDQQLTAMEGNFETFCGAERKRPADVDISPST